MSCWWFPFSDAKACTQSSDLEPHCHRVRCIKVMAIALQKCMTISKGKDTASGGSHHKFLQIVDNVNVRTKKIREPLFPKWAGRASVEKSSGKNPMWLCGICGKSSESILNIRISAMGTQHLSPRVKNFLQLRIANLARNHHTSHDAQIACFKRLNKSCAVIISGAFLGFFFAGKDCIT